MALTRRKSIRLAGVAMALLGLVLWARGAAGAGPLVLEASIEGVIDPFAARYLERVLGEAQDRGAQLVILRLDTPGGLDSSMRQMVQAVLASDVPLVVYVAPEGARAASAGTFIALSAAFVAMAPETTIGAAHPVAIGDGASSAVVEKIENEAVAYIRSLAERRGRNADWAEQAVRESVALAAREAVAEGVIDAVADDIQALIGILQESGLVDSGNVELQAIPMSAPEQLFHRVANPEIAFLLLTLGLWALVAEFYNPGALLPALTGIVLLVLAFVGLGSLPVNWAGLGLVLLGAVLFVADIWVAGIGFSIGGAISLLIGGLLLFRPIGPISPAAPRLGLSPWLAAAIPLATLLLWLLVFRAGALARRLPVQTPAERLVGATGRAVTALEPEGVVVVAGEEWSAQAVGGPVREGDEVEVVAVEGLRVMVRGRPEKTQEEVS